MERSKGNVSDFNKLSRDLQQLVANRQTTQQTECLRFYWLEACEGDKYGQVGTVFMFGKVYDEKKKSHESCCVTVRNIHKQVFILPRQKRFDAKTKQMTDKPVSMTDVLNELAEKYPNSRRFTCKKVNKKYCFTNENIPQESEYLQVRYPASCKDIFFKHQEKAETFEYVFGTTVGPLERLILENKLKGPCWLNLRNFKQESNKISYCQSEFIIENMSDIELVPGNFAPPPLTVFVINVTTCYNPKNNEKEIVLITLGLQPEYCYQVKQKTPCIRKNILLIRHPSGPRDLLPRDIPNPQNEIIKCQNEIQLLSCFINQFIKYKPDLIVGYDLIGYQLEFLMSRCEKFRITSWSQLGKLKQSIIPRNYFQTDAMPGRLICDIKISAEELVRSRNYDLETLCKVVLDVDNGGKSVDVENVSEMFNSPSKLNNLMSVNVRDANYIIEIMHKISIFPLAVELTNLSGFILSKTLIGHRSERIEYLLLHAFNAYNYILPDKKKYERDDAGGTAKPTYQGGLVLEPKIGFYDTITVLLDFNSLYPTIFSEYNVCFTTRTLLGKEDTTVLPATSTILPKEMERLVNLRRNIKYEIKRVKNTEDTIRLNVKEKALKLTANSIYGCLGYQKSRFYCKELAAFVAEKGRDILRDTKATAEKLKMNVIYGDTDSIMINTEFKDVGLASKLSTQVVRTVNCSYKYVRLDYDRSFKFLLLLQKKKYAGLRIKIKNEFEKEIKGLDIIRRDWSRIASETGMLILDNILSEQPHPEKINKIYKILEKVRQDLISDKVPRSSLTITKKLGKDPASYENPRTLPHVLVALRMNSKHTSRKFKRDDTISYVICDDGTRKIPVLRAYHLHELAASQKLKIDVNYYLAQQIYPIANRLCEWVDNIDPNMIAQSLGIDPKQYRAIKPHRGMDTNFFNHPSLYDDLEPFSYICIKCNKKITISHPMKYVGSQVLPTFDNCPYCEYRASKHPEFYANELKIELKRKKENINICKNPMCGKLCSCVGAANIEYLKYLKYLRYLFNIRYYNLKHVELEPALLYEEHEIVVDDLLEGDSYYSFNVSELFVNF